MAAHSPQQLAEIIKTLPATAGITALMRRIKIEQMAAVGTPTREEIENDNP